jgi:hypothetical protein
MFSSTRLLPGSWPSARGFGSGSVGGVEHVEEGADLELVEDGMAKVTVAVDLVAVAAAVLGAYEVSPGDELGDDALGSALGDTYLLRDVTGAAVWVAGDAQQHMRVVAEKHPRGPVVRRSFHAAIFIAILVPRIFTHETWFAC